MFGKPKRRRTAEHAAAERPPALPLFGPIPPSQARPSRPVATQDTPVRVKQPDAAAEARSPIASSPLVGTVSPAAPATPAEPPAGAVVAVGLTDVEAAVHGWPAAPTGAEITADPVFGIDVVFGDAGNAGRATRSGWSAAEPGSMWSVGKRCELRLPPSVGRVLLVQLAPFTHADGLVAQRIVVHANGIASAAFSLADFAVISIPLPATGPGEPLHLVFETPDAARPADVSGFPDDRELAFSFRRILVLPEAAGSAEACQPVHVPDGARGLPADELMARFESLGENCEFGLVQRACGVDPLGLLRFASAPLPKLRAALRAGFAGMGQPDAIDVRLSPDGQEYMVHDRAFDFNYHAWVKAEEQTSEMIHAREARRVPFLVRKLLDDLGTGEKIFVFHGMDPLTLENARDLKAEIGRYGPGLLLWVEMADAGHPPGSLKWVGAGLLKGYMDRFAPGDDAQDLSLQCWIDLCQRAVFAAGAPLVPDAVQPS